MNKRDALRLKPGDVVLYGDSMWSAAVSEWQHGEIVRVTPRGGINLLPLGPAGGNLVRKKRQHVPVWVPYHHIHSKRTVEPRSVRH